jgi:hypothetical protein
MNKNLNQYIDDLLLDVILPSDMELKSDTKSHKVSMSRKNQKATEKTKAILSKAHTGKKMSKEHLQKIHTKGKETKWLQLLEKYPLQTILDAQSNNDNHQSNTCKELGISFTAYKKLCKHYDIELKKSIYEKSEFARIEQSEPIKVYLYDKTKVNGKGKFLNEYYSIAETSRQLNIEKSRGHIISVLKKKRPHTHGYYFEYKNK